MRFIKRSTRATPKVSLVLLDWSVRESFHLLHYLSRQTVDRDQFEVVVIEYYAREAEGLRPFRDQVDTWLPLEMPEACIYHKHLMYNCGLFFARGEIVVLCDSDAMVRPSFIRSIIEVFESQDNVVLHLDQFRNMRKDFYPFSYPSFEEVLGDGCINNVSGKTIGILDRVDPLHSRNYGACMAARRADLIAIGGADEHDDYLGHICGPYEMTFRLVNHGLKEVWHDAEFLYHTWHPGQAGIDDYQGPHDGQQMSSTALEALITKRTRPLVENRGVHILRVGEPLGVEMALNYLIDERYFIAWDRIRRAGRKACANAQTDLYRGFKISRDSGRFHASKLVGPEGARIPPVLEASSWETLIKKIDERHPTFLWVSEKVNSGYSAFALGVWIVAAPILGMIRICLKGFARKNQGGHAFSPLFTNGRGLRLFPLFRQLSQQYKKGWLAAKQQRAYTDRWANHLIANLYYAGRDNLWRASEERTSVVTTSLFLALYLKALIALGILPPARIKRLKNRKKITAYFESLVREPGPGRLIVARNIYIGYYGLIQSSLGLNKPLIF